MSLRITEAPPDTKWLSRQRMLRLAYDGHLPAEALSTKDRETLVWDLHAAGWTDCEIATHTRMTTFTTGRIRARLGLAAHHRKAAA